MVCPKCKNQYDIYNSVVNDDTGLWECPDCGEALNDSDVAEKVDKNNTGLDIAVGVSVVLDIREIVSVDISGKCVVIEIKTDTITVQNLVNSFIETRLEAFIELGILKYYKNRQDFFILMPQDGWQPVEVLVKIKKRLRL